MRIAVDQITLKGVLSFDDRGAVYSSDVDKV